MSYEGPPASRSRRSNMFVLVEKALAAVELGAIDLWWVRRKQGEFLATAKLESGP